MGEMEHFAKLHKVIRGDDYMKVKRAAENPLIMPKDVKPSREDFEVVCVFNAGVTRFEGDVLLLLRVAEVPKNSEPDKKYISPIFDVASGEIIKKEFDRSDSLVDFSDSRFVRRGEEVYLTSISHFRVARSNDGINFEIEDTPAMVPANEYEMFGIEDPRITLMGDTYYLNYSCCAPLGVTTCLASTKDFKNFTRHGVIFPPDNKDVAIFPEQVQGKYYAFHRAASAEYDKRELWLAESPDLVCWGNHRRIMAVNPGGWESRRLGCSAVPFRVAGGWLEIYHAADHDNRYCLGAALLDADEPWKVLARTTKPILEPEADYEVHGFFGNVVFNCGALVENGMVKLYYGAADTCIAYAEIELAEILAALK